MLWDQTFYLKMKIQRNRQEEMDEPTVTLNSHNCQYIWGRKDMNVSSLRISKRTLSSFQISLPLSPSPPTLCLLYLRSAPEVSYLCGTKTQLLSFKKVGSQNNSSYVRPPHQLAADISSHSSDWVFQISSTEARKKRREKLGQLCICSHRVSPIVNSTCFFTQ